MNDTIPGIHLKGQILLEGRDIYAPDINVASLRQQVGMVFQKPNPFLNRYMKMWPLGRVCWAW